MTEWNTLRCFNRRRFAVSLQWSFANDFDLSWADAATRAGIRAGRYEVYTFRVVVLLDGCIVGADYLGESVYDDPTAFAREHLSGSAYFPALLRAAVQEARAAIYHRPRVRPPNQPMVAP